MRLAGVRLGEFTAAGDPRRLRLQPGTAAAVIGRPAAELTNMRVPLDSDFGVIDSYIVESLCSAKAPEQLMSTWFDKVARHFADSNPEIDRPVARAVAVLRAQPDRRVSALAAEVGLSERQLRRRFEVAVGYGPKRLGRIFRFQRLLDSVHASHGQPGWARLAVAAGYVDQSHMINECMALAGGPPTRLPVAV